MTYRVIATVSWVVDGMWRTSRQIPTFCVEASSGENACLLAERVINPTGKLGTSITACTLDGDDYAEGGDITRASFSVPCGAL